MTATSRKATVIVLVLAGLAAAVTVPSDGVFTGWPQIILLVVAAVVSLVPHTRAAIARRLDAIRHPSPRRRARAAVVIALASSGYLLFTGWYQQRDLFPKYHDENMHLVQIQMLARGMLWREPHPLAVAFETFHVLTEPVYASIYFPGTALMYVPSVWLHLPRWLMPLLAASASVGLVYVIVTELLDGAFGALAVVLMLSASQFRYLSLIVMSHTVMILLGLLLVWAYLRWRRERKLGWAIAIGAIAGWAAITRPVDAICWAAPVGIAILCDLRGFSLRKWITTGALIVSGAAPFLALQVIFNYGVTGNPFMTPYRLSADLFTPQIAFGFHDFDPAVRPKTELLQKILYYDAFTIPAAERHRVDTLLTTWTQTRLPAIVYNDLPTPLPVALIPASLLALAGRRWVLWAQLPLFIGAYALFAYFIPNYIAIYTAPLIYAILLGAYAVIEAFPHRYDVLTSFLFTGLLAICLTSLPETSYMREDNRPAPMMGLNSLLDDGVVIVDGAPQRLQKPAIVLIRYRKSASPHEEPVYTIDAAWPDDARVIRAHDLGQEKNLELLRYYAERQPERHVYFLDRGDRSIRYAGRAGELWALFKSRPMTRTMAPTATGAAP